MRAWTQRRAFLSSYPLVGLHPDIACERLLGPWQHKPRNAFSLIHDFGVSRYMVTTFCSPAMARGLSSRDDCQRVVDFLVWPIFDSDALDYIDHRREIDLDGRPRVGVARTVDSATVVIVQLDDLGVLRLVTRVPEQLELPLVCGADVRMYRPYLPSGGSGANYPCL